MNSRLEGTRLGPYQVGVCIGAGGMGEVYRALDTRLDRTVAIKLLPTHVALAPAARERFEREARAVAALNHPNICTVHDVGVHDGVDYLVMEHLEGETLAARLERGPLPSAEALQIGIQIASALARAHRAGIVHRDLKPGNIFLVRGAGAGPPIAKLLDFGLAKTGGAAPAGAPGSVTMAPGLTTPGTILGTVQYMAPEQLEGRESDARTDIFAFGAVLYEMLAGRKAFAADSQAGVMAAILDREPPPLPAGEAVRQQAIARIVDTCLAKDPDDRWQSARDLVRELTWALESNGNARPPRPDDPPRRARPWLWLVAVLGASGAALLVGTRLVRQETDAPPSLQFQIPTPMTNEPMSFALSPDATHIVFVALADGASKLLLRPLDQLAAKTLAGTEGAIFPFWSPDGRTIGFFAGGKLKTVGVDGGAPRVLADAPNGRGGTWNRDGTIIFAPTTASGLVRLASTGGSAVVITRLSQGEASHRWPEFLPDGRHFLFHSVQGAKGTSGLFLGSLDGGDPVRLLEGEVPTTFIAPDTLLLERKDGVVAVRFDASRGVVAGGGAAPVTEAVGWDATWNRAALSASTAGVIAYRTALAVPRRLVWFDRAGAEHGTLGPVDENAPACPEISKDGRRAAIHRTLASNTDVWIFDLARAVPTRFTFDDAVDFFPLWAPSGDRIIYASNKGGSYEFYDKALIGTGNERQLPISSPAAKLPMSISSDGRYLLYAMQVPGTGSDLWAVTLNGEGKPFPVVQTPFDETAGQFSPDGHWIAYESNESGQIEVYVRPFPEAGTATQVSSAGGAQPRWRPDGKELFYVAPDWQLMAVAMTATADGAAPDIGTPRPLFTAHLATGMNVYPAVGTKQQYAVAPDGRFLMSMPVEGGTIPPITIMTGWDKRPRQ